MWHRILNGSIQESVDQFGDDWMRQLSDGQLREQYGWVRGTAMPKPYFDPDNQQLAPAFTLNLSSLEVQEWYVVVPVDTSLPSYQPTQFVKDRAVVAQAAQLLATSTPAQIKTWCEGNFPSLTLAERDRLAVLAQVVGLLIRKA